MSYSLESLEYLAERLRSISLNEIEGGELPNSGDFNLESRTDRQKKETRKILSDLCSIAREAHSQGADNVEEGLQRVDGTLNSFVRSNALAGSTYSRRRARCGSRYLLSRMSLMKILWRIQHQGLCPNVIGVSWRGCHR